MQVSFIINISVWKIDLEYESFNDITILYDDPTACLQI